MGDMPEFITGRDILALGIPPGKHIGAMLKKVRHAEAYTMDRQRIVNMIRDDWAKIEAGEAARIAARLPLKPVGATPWEMYLDPFHADDDAGLNLIKVTSHMTELLRTPVAARGVIMPDAMPAGTICVGAVVASPHIHPGWHSADICCSMYASMFAPETDLKDLMDHFMELTQFGNQKGSQSYPLDLDIAVRIQKNRFTCGAADAAFTQLGTQGDGNHFAYFGHLDSTGQATLVTHHGSRGLGAHVYKEGMKVAETFRAELSPETPAGHAWIPHNTDEGWEYWEALQIVRDWTKENHRVLHDALGLPTENGFWNEHNFVFRKEDGLFYHAKGATPSGFKWAEDATAQSLIPMNMAEPILIVERHPEAPDGAMGFAPHGAGRNYSRSEHIRRDIADLDAETAGLDIRFYCGRPDPAELPSAYKDAATVVGEIDRYKLAHVVDRVMPYGTIMAGDWEYDMPWKVKARAKQQERQQ